MNKSIVRILAVIFLFSEIVNCQEKIAVNDVSKIFNKGDFSATVELATKAIQQSPDQAEFYYYLAASYAKLSKNAEAVSAFRMFLKKADYSKNAWLLRMGFQGLVSVYRIDKNYPAIIEDTNSFLEKIKGNPNTEHLESFCKNVLAEAWRETGYLRASKNDYSGAIDALRKTLEYKSDDYASMERIASYYKNLGKTNESAEYYFKAAMGWSSWRNKTACLVPLVNLLWETDGFEKFSERAESDTVSYNVIYTISRIRHQDYSRAFAKMANIEEQIGSKGEISFRLLREVILPKVTNPHLCFAFVSSFPEHSSSVWALNLIMNSAKNSADVARVVRMEIAPALMNLVDKLNIQTSGKFLPFVVDMKFLGLDESREIIEQKVNLYEEFRKKYPDDAIREIIRREAALYTDMLSDYKKGKELYEILVKKYGQKNLIPQLARCLVNLGEFDNVFMLINEYLAGGNIGEYAKFQAGQILIQANFLDQGVKVLNELDSVTKNRFLKQQIKDVLKDYRQYLNEDITIDTQKITVIFNVYERRYFYTNFISLTEDCHLLYQETETVEIVPFSAKRQYIGCEITGRSGDRISLTEPYTMISRDGDVYTVFMKKSLALSPDRWRKPEGMSIIFPWQDVKTEDVRVVRNYAVENEEGVASIRFERLKPGVKIEVYFTSRAGRFVSVFPENSEPGPGGAMVFMPNGEIFEVKIKLKPSADLLAYYPKVKIIEQRKSESTVSAVVYDFSLNARKTAFHIKFDSQLTVYSVLKQDETIYEIDEKIDI